MMSLTGETFWITGASRGIGKAIAEELVRCGARVVLSARSAETLQHLADTLGAAAMVVPCDVSDPQQVQQAYRQMETAGWQPTGLVNNAGIGNFQPFTELSLEAVQAMVAVNLLGAMYCTAAVLPSMLERKQGTIVNILSVAAVTPFRHATVYGATKAGLQMFADALRAEVRSEGIRVINVLPGATATDIWSPEVLERYQAQMMSPTSVASAVVALLQLPADSHPEMLILRPGQGDL